MSESFVDIVFDGPPGPVAGRFVEVENMDGASVGVGEWIDRGDGYWALRLKLANNQETVKPPWPVHPAKEVPTQEELNTEQ